jgi:hypothetical protein
LHENDNYTELIVDISEYISLNPQLIAPGERRRTLNHVRCYGTPVVTASSLGNTMQPIDINNHVKSNNLPSRAYERFLRCSAEIRAFFPISGQHRRRLPGFSSGHQKVTMTPRISLQARVAPLRQAKIRHSFPPMPFAHHLLKYYISSLS